MVGQKCQGQDGDLVTLGNELKPSETNAGLQIIGAWCGVRVCRGLPRQYVQ
jgi:hypothetical protein